MQIRIPVIPLFNDNEEHFKLYADFLMGIKDAVDLVQLLPYHTLGISKHDRLLKNEKIFAAEPPLMSSCKAYASSCRTTALT